ncbi:MAG: protein adenylyltransferase SelO [Betaproteobacteria bacterium]
MSLKLPFDNTYVRVLSGAFVEWQPARVPAPRLLYLNHSLARALGLDLQGSDEEALAAAFSGNVLPAGAQPIAQAYAGHQFGGFSPSLGDGRALLVGEVIDRAGRRRDIAFKGSGRTPFSRGGDGKAAVGPMLREVLVGEAMHALGIPTTRALAVVATGEPVLRESVLPGAVLTRVAASHLRVGTFEYFAARGELDKLRRLADYALARHDPALAPSPSRYLDLLRAVALRQARLIAQWMSVGFIHGVMNTDNMTLSGETIDYGPCAFLEAYDPATVFSSIDRQGRYAFGNQPAIARWNLTRLAEALLPLMHEDPDAAVPLAVEVLEAFADDYERAALAGLRRKLGLRASAGAGISDAEDTQLAADWLALLHAQRVDFTLAWRHLAATAEGADAPLLALFTDAAALADWRARWRRRCAADDAVAGVASAVAGQERARAMRGVNPRIIPRNHQVEAALAAASERGDLVPFNALLTALVQPYSDDPALAPYAEPAPAEVTACYKTFCGT